MLLQLELFDGISSQHSDSKSPLINSALSPFKVELLLLYFAWIFCHIWTSICFYKMASEQAAVSSYDKECRKETKNVKLGK